MDENAKSEFDALHALSEQAWRDWDHKTRHEWRLSFGVWAALLAASAALLKTSFRSPLLLIVLGGGVVFLVHVVFVAWIQVRLRQYRMEYLALRARMPAAVRPESPASVERPWYKSPTVWTQAAITLLLIGVLLVAATSAQPAE